MSVNRILILLVVVVVVLFVVTLALGNRNSGGSVDPKKTWLARMTRPQKFNLAEISPTNGWQNGRWTIAKGVREAGLDIAPSKSGRAIRRLKLSLQGSSGFQLEFTPRPDKDEPGKYADTEATALRVREVKPGQKPLELTILQHGGLLVVRRANAAAPAMFALE